MPDSPLAVDEHGYILRPDAATLPRGNPRLTVGVPLKALEALEKALECMDNDDAPIVSTELDALCAWARHIREKATGAAHPVLGPWKTFGDDESEFDSLCAWVDAGGVAVLLDSGRGPARLFAGSPGDKNGHAALYAAATSIGCNRSWIQDQTHPRPFFNLRGAILEKALALCARGGA